MKRRQAATKMVEVLFVGLLILSLSACSDMQTTKKPDKGTVLLQLSIDEKGQVQNIEVLESEPPGYFEESAVKAFREAKFSPATKGGVPVKSSVKIRVKYDSNGSMQSETPLLD